MAESMDYDNAWPGSTPQRAYLVAVELKPERKPGRDTGWTAEESLAELAELAGTAGAVVVGQTIQRRVAPDPATCIGEGKAVEIEAERARLGFDLVIFDDELSPVHQRNLENIIQCAIIDRTALILDIFARRAKSRESKLQVELAQLEYRLTRLAGKGVDLSRLGGGIGTRGPGETKLETDRRRIRARISRLRAELAEVARHRGHLREDRQKRSLLPVVALTGYTNAGKSTLHRALTGSDVLVEDRLFATLDATARRAEPEGGQPFILIDTVGFVQKLPHQLVAAFRSTLEEVTAADLILHVVDASHPKREEQVATVDRVLAELGAATKPRLLVLNKIDRLHGPETAQAELESLRRLYPASVAVSAATGENLDGLLRAINQTLAASRRRRLVEIVIPYSEASWVSWLHERAQVLAEEHTPEGTKVRAVLEEDLAGQLLARSQAASHRRK